MLLESKYNFLKPIKTDNLIRMGAKFDGGYVVDSKIINSSSMLISFGLGTDWSFELDYLKLTNKKIHIYDYTTSYWPYIKKIIKYFRRFITFRTSYKNFIIKLDNFLKLKKFLSLPNVKFFKEKITFSIKDKNDTDIETVFSRFDCKDGIVLKCDIEGSEYEIIEQITKYSSKINMLIIEFHWINQTDNQTNFIQSVKKLEKNFKIIHIHGNNYDTQSNTGLPNVLEITFTNMKYAQGKIEYNHKFPIKDLDFPNDPLKEDIKIFFKS